MGYVFQMMRSALVVLVSVLLLAAISCSSKGSSDPPAAKQSPTTADQTSAPDPTSTSKPTPSATVKKSPPAAESPDLEKICAAAERILADPKADRLAEMSLVIRTLEDPDIKRGFGAIQASGREAYYPLAKQIAKEAGFPDWECPALQKLIEQGR